MMRYVLKLLPMVLTVTACAQLRKAPPESVNRVKAQPRIASFSKEIAPQKLRKGDRLYFELINEKPFNLTEAQIYSKVGDAFRKSDLKACEAYSQLLLHRYPQSIFADNALYLTGSIAFAQKKYAKSLETYNRLITLYPNSNKVVAALYAKGAIFRRLNLKKQAQAALQKVVKDYKGSPEAQRAASDLRMIR